jgi:hypothetical protein
MVTKRNPRKAIAKMKAGGPAALEARSNLKLNSNNFDELRIGVDFLAL